MNNEELDTKAVGKNYYALLWLALYVIIFFSFSYVLEHEVNKESPITVENGTFRWGADEPTALENININIKQGSLTAVSIFET